MRFTPQRLPNTLGIGSVAAQVAEICSLDDLIAARAVLSSDHSPIVLGAGSNVVLPPRVERPVLLMRIRGLRLTEIGAGIARLDVGAGEIWHDVVRFALGQGYRGLENLALIPGTAGAAPVQNIGAYGVEIASCLESVEVFDWSRGQLNRWSAAACEFGYRDSLFKHAAGRGRIILGISLVLSRSGPVDVNYPDLARELNRFGKNNPQPIDIAEAVIRVRRRKLPDPRRTGNAGSFFKNPLITSAHSEALAREEPDLIRYPQADGRVKLAAGQLIDRCGWRGRHQGKAGVWLRQALVLVNVGGADARDLLDLAAAIQGDVAARYGVVLDIEPQVL
jgi:UDP-N-acetylmuramate dehydrogenase